MADIVDIVTRIATDSDVLRVYPNATVQIYDAGTSNLVATAIADANGVWSVPTLATGAYDIKVDSQLVATIQHVMANHTHLADETWVVFFSGAITTDHDEENTQPVYHTSVAGNIISVKITSEQADATGDITVHILKGSTNGGSALTVASDSVWNHQINPGATYRDDYTDNDPGIAVAANQAVTVGIDWTANSVEGINVVMIFRPTPA